MEVAGRLREFGQTIFAEITRLAGEHDAVNLGQGYPNFDGPDFVKAAALAALQGGRNQYPPTAGEPGLQAAVAARFTFRTGLAVEASRHVTVTSGCTEALAATFLGLVEPGDEVVLIEPYYDSYPACVALAQATPRYVTLRPPEFRLDRDELRRAFGSRTKAIVVNTPHNPTGRVFDDDELGMIAGLCEEFGAIAITDEVYEDIVFVGEHRSLASLPGMWDRTVTLSSLGKSFSLTGWKVGWAVAPEPLTAGVRAAHQFLTFATPGPLQHGAAAALAAGEAYYKQLQADYHRKRDLLVGGLASVGFGVFPPDGTYFVLADHTPLGFADDVTLVRHLITDVGVAAIPPSAFYHDRRDGSSLVRFAFCKDDQTLHEAVARLAALAG